MEGPDRPRLCGQRRGRRRTPSHGRALGGIATVEHERTRKVAHGQHRVYLQRADELIDSVADAEARGHSLAAGVAAVHAAIAASDAVTAAKLGLRSIGPDHEAAIGLLSRCGAKGAQEHAKQLKRILGVKNLMAYDDRLPTKSEARDVVERARRLHGWARQVLRTANEV